MPANIIKSFSDKTGKPESEVESLWNKAKEIAKEQGKEENFSYITGILKKMLKMNESDTESFIEFLGFQEIEKYNH